MPWAEAFIKSQTVQPTAQPEAGERVISYTQALHEALSAALALDPNVIVMGQGVNDPVGMFGLTTGLHQQFGTERVFDTPLSEDGMTGVCTGAAMNGLRPVILHNRPDFLLLTFNQLVNHASKVHFMDRGRNRVPMVVWAAIGRGWGSGPQHSQAIHGLLLSVPGLKIVLPGTPYDAKGLMLSAIADNNPVIVFDHRWLMKDSGHVPEEIYHVPIGKGTYRRRGGDLTIVGTSHTLSLALRALDSGLCRGVEADVIDLRSVKPLDKEIILESVAKTGRLLAVDPGWALGGVCAEVGCLVAENGFELLKAPVRRIGLPDSPTPAGYTLEQYYYPNEQTIAHTIRAMCE